MIEYVFIHAVYMIYNPIFSYIFRFAFYCPLIYITAATINNPLTYLIGIVSPIVLFMKGQILNFLKTIWQQSKRKFYTVIFIIIIICFPIAYSQIMGFWLRGIKNDRIKIINPILQPKEEELIDSEWISIANRVDYKVFYFRVKQYAERDKLINERYSRVAERYNFEVKIRGGE